MASTCAVNMACPTLLPWEDAYRIQGETEDLRSKTSKKGKEVEVVSNVPTSDDI